MDDSTSLDYEFEGFRLDTALQVLVSPAGEALPLPSRAFATLRYLVERAGETVDKSVLMANVWPTTVVAENNLNQCILALRRVFGEAAGARRFILTIPGRGFRFVAPVRVVPRGHAAPQETAASLPAAPRGPLPAPRSWRGARWLAAAVLCAVLGLGLWLWLGHPQAVTDPAEYLQLTDVTDTAVAPVLSADGRMLAFIRNGSEFRGRGQVWIKTLPDGEPVQLTHADGELWAPVFSPDGTRVAYSEIDDRRGTWDTWTIPVDGRSEATKLLPNAQALTYIGAHEVLYSEFDVGQHLSVATSFDDRSAHRQVYSPEHERGMAHFSYLSPDRKSVLVAEMGPTGAFGPCRLVPFGGGGPGYEVGPPDSACRFAAWSPDGAWMYFSAIAPSGVHLWRQRFPHGVAQQITFGPSQEQTVFATPDGSLLTAIGMSHSELWLHDAQGERLLTNEGNAIAPWLSADARHAYFIEVHVAHSISLMRLDVASGRKETLFKGYSVFAFDVTPDERQTVFTTPGNRQTLIWAAPLDGHTPPRLLVFGGDEPAFGGGYIYYRRVEEHANYLHRIRPDGSGDSQLLPDPIIDFFGAAPDGKAVLVSRPAGDIIKDTWAIPIDSPGAARVINRANSPARWSSDGRTLYVELNVQDKVALRGSTLALPTGPDDLPLSTQMAADTKGPVIPYQVPYLAMGADPSVYVFVKSETRQNIYRIPLH
jgi:DNA-binding winged helix-turn-helix (wHTH) protein/dipeptidyl aminopeptidase/acylaminoacyl peptidase